MTSEEMRLVREAMYEVELDGSPTGQRINAELGVGNAEGLRGDQAVIELLRRIPGRTQVPVYREMVAKLLTYLGSAAPVVDKPPPAPPKPPAPTPSVASDCPLSGPTPPAFQWPVGGNPAPVGSGGPSGTPLEKVVHHGGFVCVANVAAEGTNATSGPNGQVIGIDGRSKGRIRVNTRGGAESDGGMRDFTNYIELEPREGDGTITRRGYDIFCSEPDAITVRTALWTRDPGGTVDGGVYILRRVTPTHFIGNWSDPALDYENRPFSITGADQPDRDRFTTKAGMDSNGTYGWRVDKPMTSTEAHPSYEEGGYSDKGDFLLRLFHDNGGEDVGRYSTFRTYNEGRGIAFATSDGRYSSCPDSLVIQPGVGGAAGRVDLAVNGVLRVIETYPLADGRVGLCFTPATGEAVAPFSR